MRRALPGMEALDKRLLPTIVFAPARGAESLQANYQPDGMQSPTVNVIFTGTYWTTTAQGKQDEATLLAGVKSIVSGPYLSGLTQYGSNGKATFGTSWNDPSYLVSPNPSKGSLELYIDNSIGKYGADPGSHSIETAPIYMVFQDPNSSGGFNGGFNVKGVYGKSNENIHMIYAGTSLSNPNHPSGPGNGVWMDFATELVSHEMAETMSDPNSTGGPCVLPAPYNVNGQPKVVQVADGEQEHNDTYRLNGVLVQAYWSQKDKADIIPDGNTQEQFVLTPIWNNPTASNGTFTGKFDLSINGNQASGNQVVVTTASNGVLSITANGQPFAFPAGSITGITVTKPGKLMLNDSSNSASGTITVGTGTTSGWSSINDPGEFDIVNANTTGATSTLTITGGSGNDNFVFTHMPEIASMSLQGGRGTNTLTGPSLLGYLTAWSVTGTNSGTVGAVGSLSFTGIANLVGGSDGNDFYLSAASKVSTINGGTPPAGVQNWLEYSGNESVTVNLATGSATGVNNGAANSVKNIQDALGGSGVNVLTGNAQGNILVGGAKGSRNTINGGAGRSLLIAGYGSATITGGANASGGGDIIVGGNILEDDADALDSILAEWQSGQSYAARVSALRAFSWDDTLYWGTTIGATVKDNSQSNTLTAAPTAGLDWIFANESLDRVVNYHAGDAFNNTNHM